MSETIDLLEAINMKAEAHFEWAHAHPGFGLLIAVVLLVLWLAGLLLRWKWALRWNFNGTLIGFDNCRPETRRCIQIAIVSVVLIACIILLISYE